MKRGQDIIGISATRASAILGLNSFKTPVLAWQEIQEKIKPGFNAKNGFILPDFEESPPLRWGKAFENSVIELAQKKSGLQISEREVLSSDMSTINSGIPRIPPAFCYIDGRYFDETKTLHEGKTTNNRSFGMKWGEPGTDKVPQEVQVQVQHQMMCYKAEKVIVSVLVFPNPVDDWEGQGWTVHYDNLNGIYFMSRDGVTVTPDQWGSRLAEMGYFHQYHIERQPEVQKLLRELYNDFWSKYVLTETPPSEVDYSDVRRLFTAPKGTLVVSEKIAQMMREYKDIGREIGTGGHLKKRQNRLKVDILKFARKETTVEDEESQEKIVFMYETGIKLGSFNGKTFRS